MDVEFTSTSGKRGAAAFREWRDILEALPDAIKTKGFEVSLRKGAQFLAKILRSIIPISTMVRSEGGRHLRHTVAVRKGRAEYFPSYLVRVGNQLARHYHLLEFGFTKKGGKGIKEATYIINNATQRTLPEVENVVAFETKQREKQIADEAEQIGRRGY